MVLSVASLSASNDGTYKNTKNTKTQRSQSRGGEEVGTKRNYFGWNFKSKSTTTWSSIIRRICFLIRSSIVLILSAVSSKQHPTRLESTRSGLKCRHLPKPMQLTVIFGISSSAPISISIDRLMEKHVLSWTLSLSLSLSPRMKERKEEKYLFNRIMHRMNAARTVYLWCSNNWILEIKNAEKKGVFGKEICK